MKKILSIVMLLITVIPTVTPVVVNGQEVTKAEVERIQKNIKNNKKVRDISSSEDLIKNTTIGCAGTICDSGTGYTTYNIIKGNNFEYKINAVTHEVTVRIMFNKDLEINEDETIMTITDGVNTKEISEKDTTNFQKIGTELDSAGNTKYIYEIKTGDLDTEGFAKEGQYSISFYSKIIKLGTKNSIEITKNDGTKIVNVKIGIPKTILQDGILYSVLGDNVSIKTDQSEVSDVEKTTPENVSGYGIYELESIGYEDSNPDTINWDENDLTLAKYDHVIRPINSNYMLENNIDASIVSTNTDLDMNGGFGTDGYRPIGQKIKTTTGEDSIPFSGIFTGEGEKSVTPKPDNYYIKNITINNSTLSNVGIFSSTDTANINNLGVIDSQITGGNLVGNIAGDFSGIIENVYVTTITGDAKIEGKGDEIGGLVGDINTATSQIISTEKFAGDIPGLNLASDIQPSQQGDKDGYKTFSNINVISEGDNVGGIAGVAAGRIDRVYNKGTIKGKNTIGGIIGGSKNSELTLNISNVYNTGEISGNEVGGIIGKISSPTIIENTYNSGNISGTNGIGGIIGNYFTPIANISNVYNSGEINLLSGAGTGGIIGTYENPYLNGTDYANGNVENVLNLGDVLGTNGAGIIGEGQNNNETGIIKITNTLNLGKAENALFGTATTYPVAVEITNGYYLEGYKGTAQGNLTTASNVRNTSWWQTTLNFSKDWNIASGDSLTPSPDADDSDESIDDEEGTIIRIVTPTILETSTKLEVPEQISKNLPELSVISKLDYKINATNLDINIKLDTALGKNYKGIRNGTVGLYEIGDLTTPLVTQPVTFDIATQYVSLTNNGLIKSDTNYNIVVKEGDTITKNGMLTIHTPKQIEQGGVTYAAIGDGVNIPTDVANKVDSDKVEPTGTDYGIYELESIGYEDANTVVADWTTNDLTLAKYDHVIRPANGKYMLENNIDASIVSTNKALDIEGGFGNDGYRPIGKKTDNTDGIAFTGILSGLGDISVRSKPENYYIKNLYINLTNSQNIGLFSQLNGGEINNLGIIDPKISGKSNIGSFAGKVLNGSFLTNVYATESKYNTSYNILGTTYTGGIAGILDKSTIQSNSRFMGEIPGIDLSADTQPSLLADKDGYKTFNTVNILSASTPSETGGIVASALNNSKIDKVYNKGMIKGYPGGIAYELTDSVITNAYNQGKLEGGYYTSEVAGGIVQIAKNSQITNVYNTGDIVAKANAGGILGEGTSTTVENTLNIGNISLLGGAPSYGAGGIVGEVTGASTVLPLKITNALNIGNVTQINTIPPTGGILGSANTVDEGNVQLTNVLNVGNVPGGGSIEGRVPQKYVVNNAYYLDSGEYIKKSGTSVPAMDLSDTEWWINILKFSSDNWNINALDTIIPSPDSDNSDESQDDNQGTVKLGNFPKVKETGATKLEIPEQISNTLPKVDFELTSKDYKINAMNLDTTYHISTTGVKGMTGQLEIYDSSDLSTPIISQDIVYGEDGVTQNVTVINDGRLKAANVYDVKFTVKGRDFPDGNIEIATPNQITEDGIIYAAIGDGVNESTDVLDKVSSDVVNPGTIDKYGIYELESIGYEDANAVAADWTANDLTLAKYDHVIRPANGKYMLENNIDATATLTNTDVDNIGGFGPDGYRSIGKKLNNTIGVPFTGIISGKGDVLYKDKPENYYINNLFINTTSNSVGLVSQISGGNINNLGIIDPKITGGIYVGSFAGETNNGSVLKNVYATDTTDDSTAPTNDINGTGTLGGITAVLDNSTIESDGRFTGEIPGVDLSGDTQPNNSPDKDGYKTFNTVDIANTSTQGKSGIAGNVTNGSKIDKVYNKGIIDGYAGGIVGKLIDSTVSNSYNAGNIYSNKTVTDFGSAGGIARFAENSHLINVYNSGDVEAKDGSGGIVGSGDSTTIDNAINTGIIKVSGATEGHLGGIFGTTNGDSTVEPIKITNALNIGEISTDGDGTAIGGIIGGPGTSEGNAELTNVLNVGNVPKGGSIEGSSPKSYIINNTYYLKTGIYNKKSGVGVSSITIADSKWWTDTLKFPTDNWNINTLDANIPSPDNDTTDESQDDNQGTVGIGNYPTVKESGDTKLEIPEQISNILPEADFELTSKDYKINAMNLDITYHFTTTGLEGVNGKISVYPLDDATTPLISQDILYGADGVAQDVTVANNNKLEGGKSYGIKLTAVGRNVPNGNIAITMPKQITQDEITYAVIGDGVNGKTDILNAINSDVVNPSTTDKYGIYELESIGYEDANATTADWSANDLTLAKYDHIIRPANGKYMLENNIDANNVSTAADKDGGFGTDGYRPIGKKIDNTDGVPFTGTISGIGDILDETKPENYYINNLFININKDNIGLISELDGGQISNLGIIDPKITGAANVGSFAGQAVNGSTLTNVYAAETVDDSEYDINGTTVAGGITGILDNSIIASDSRFKGEIPGLDLSGDAQPSMLADKDGYKTFNTADIKSGSITAGMAANAINGSKIDKVYNKGIIKGNPAGIACELYDSIITNAYNTGHLYGNATTTESAGGIARYAKDSQITNVYNTGRVEAGDNGGGIAGLSANTLVENTINLGEVSILGTNISFQAGGIVGTIKGESTLEPLKIMNSINFGKVSSPNTTAPSGGIVGSPDSPGQGNAELTNVLNIGDAVNGGSIVGLESSKFVLNNGYYLDSGTYNKKTGTAVAGSAFLSSSWWTDTLGLSVNEWNIEAGNANIPAPDSDSTDESQDDNQGTVVIGNYPTVKETGDTKLEIPDQSSSKLSIGTKNSFSIQENKLNDIDYKINAMNLDISLNIKNTIKKGLGEIEIYKKNDKSNPIISQEIKFNGKDLQIIIPNDESIKSDSDYKIVLNIDGKIQREFFIHTPKVDPGKDKNLITVNDNTAYISEGTEGIYELESIGYEEVNSDKWNNNDLTLTKYDNIIRPLDGNYQLTGNIDASVTVNNKLIDKNKGFGEDGFRPIGESMNGNIIKPFTGKLSGKITGKDESYIISNLYINQLNYQNVGLIGKTNNSKISNLGMIDPNLTGTGNVGSIVGNLENSKIENTYTLRSKSQIGNENIQITGSKNTGGLVGIANNSSIISTSRLTTPMNILGKIDNSDSNYPDKDGYKTFSTVKINASNGNVGGIAGKLNNSKVNNAYAKGSIASVDTNAGGIAGAVINSTLKNSYSNIEIVEKLSDEKSIGGIAGISSAIKLINTYSSNKLVIDNRANTSTNANVGGLIGNIDDTDGSIKNSYSNTQISDIGEKGINGGGLIGKINSKSSVNISESYALGNIDGLNTDGNNLGGLIGKITNNSTNKITLKNSISVMNLNLDNKNSSRFGMIIGSIADNTKEYNWNQIVNISNVYYFEENKNIVRNSITKSNDIEANIPGVQKVNNNDIKKSTWWKNKLKFGNEWNIDVADATLPNQNSDEIDESLNDVDGTVNTGIYPTIKEFNETYEIPEQLENQIKSNMTIEQTKEIITKTRESALEKVKSTIYVTNKRSQEEEEQKVKIGA